MTVEERFLAKVHKTKGCWQWTGHLTLGGYGRFRIGKKLHSPHRVSFEMFNGAIPEGLTVDHECHNQSTDCAGGNNCKHRSCVNPKHLKAITLAENLKRAPDWYGNKSLCKRGHEFSPRRAGNNGQRVCYRCHNMMKRRRLGEKSYALAG